MKVVYESATGRVAFILRGSAMPVLQPGQEWAEFDDDGEKPNDVYVADGELVERPSLELDWHYDELAETIVVDRIPPGARVETANWEGTVDDGFVAWPVAEAGSYQITVDCFPYRREVITVETT